MKKNTQKKLQLGKIKVAAFSKVTQAQQKGGAQQFGSNSSCAHICPTVCTMNCPSWDIC